VFLAISSDRTRHRHILKYSKIHLNVRKHFFTLKVVEHQNGFPREVDETLLARICSKLTGYGPGQPVLVHSALSRQVD